MTHVFTYRVMFAGCLSFAACAPPTDQANADQSPSSEVCDIRELACQNAVLAMVAAERGKPIPPAPHFEWLPQATDPAAPLMLSEVDAGEARPHREWDAAYAALQLLPAVQSSQHAAAHQRDAQIDKAYYSREHRSIVMAERSKLLPRDPRAEMGALAHELTHYMQDLELDIGQLYSTAPDDADAQSSVRALIEGEASYVGWSVQARLSGQTPTAADWNGYFDQLDTSYLASISGSNTALAKALDLLPYSIGGRYIANLWLTAGRAQVAELYTHIPQTFSDWMQHAGSTPTWPARELTCPVPAAPEGYELRDQTHLGALGALAFLAAGSAEDLEIVAPLRADSMFLYTPLPHNVPADSTEHLYSNQAPSVIAAWLLRFETEHDAQAYERAIPNPLSADRTYTRSRNVVALAVSTDPARRAADMLQALNCQ